VLLNEVVTRVQVTVPSVPLDAPFVGEVDGCEDGCEEGCENGCDDGREEGFLVG
jgi:hypothetical protein